MKIYQDTFNKIVTLILLAFFMIMYILSFIYQRPLDIAGIVAFLVPTVNQLATVILQDRREIRENGFVGTRTGTQPLSGGDHPAAH